MIYSWLLLVRWPNVVIVMLVQWVLYYKHIVPLLDVGGQPRVFDDLHVLLFILVSGIVTGVGNAINDLYDVDTDSLNTPDKMIVDYHLSQKAIKRFVFGAVFVGAAIAAYLASYVDQLIWFLFYPSALFILWLYSKWIKGWPGIGNFVIAALCALVFVVVVLLEKSGLNEVSQIDPSIIGLRYEEFVLILYLFSFWAFMLTWIRELVKDMQDLEGDKVTGWRTLPVVWGLRKTELFTIALLAFTAIVSVLGFLLLKPTIIMGYEWPLGLYFVALILLPLLVLAFNLFRNKSHDKYGKVSLWLKFIMLACVLFLFII